MIAAVRAKKTPTYDPVRAICRPAGTRPAAAAPRNEHAAVPSESVVPEPTQGCLPLGSRQSDAVFGQLLETPRIACTPEEPHPGRAEAPRPRRTSNNRTAECELVRPEEGKE